jgi:hypothetical protein
MALDYYLELEKYGAQEKKKKLRKLILNEFMLIDHEDTKIMTAPGIGVSFFVDDDDIEQNSEVNLELETLPNLIIAFRIDKFGLQKKGYKLLQKIVQKVLDTVEVDMHLTDEYDDAIFLKRESGQISKMFLDHDLWQVGTD